MPTPRICSVEGCGKPHLAKGFCSRHYKRWRNHGDPLAGVAFKGSAAAFLQDVLSYDTDECIIWPFSIANTGYGAARIDGTTRTVHRFICERAHGEAPSPKHEAAHSCGRKSCCNYRHLRWATRAENAADLEIHGTKLFGSKQPNSKLNDDAIRKMRALRGSITNVEIARRFGISRTYVYEILNGRQWKHVKP